MLMLEADTLAECRCALLQCDVFERDDRLKAIFIAGELRPFRFGLPQANSKRDRVDLCLSYLVELRSTDGVPVLSTFLAELCARYDDGDELRSRLAALAERVQRSARQQARPRPISPYNSPQFFEQLVRLNFKHQVDIAHRIIERNSIASFLVHGRPECGQQVLVNRLLRLSRGWSTGQRIAVHAGSSGIGKSSYSLWREVAVMLDMPALTTPARLAERVCEWWQSQDVIFIFHEVDDVPPRLLSAWLDEFWRPLASMAQERRHRTDPHTRLLLFLVDYSGDVWDSGVPLVYSPDDPGYPLAPLCLPPTGPFSRDELDHWLSYSADWLPALQIDALFAASGQGLPGRVYDILCEYCGLNWEGGITRWLI